MLHTQAARGSKRSIAADEAGAGEGHATRRKLIRAGLELFTERGFDGVGVSQILARSALPKGCFYHHFTDKQAFVIAVIYAYDAFFRHLMARSFDRSDLAPLARLRAFVHEAGAGMAKHRYTRGCLVGNLGQEAGGHTPEIRAALNGVWLGWERMVADLLQSASEAGELSAEADPTELAAMFWTGWEGAVLRAKIMATAEPMRRYEHYFFNWVRPS